MNSDQLRNIIQDTLNEVDVPGFNSDKAVVLLLLTASVESDFGQYIRQINGPALGIFQMEPNTFWDIIRHFLYYNPKLGKIIKKVCHIRRHDETMLEWNLRLAIIFARLQYYRRPQPLPEKDNYFGMAVYWKKYYNTYKGKGDVLDAVEKYKKYVLKK